MFVEPSVLKRTLSDHTDSVHGLSLHSQKSQLLSCSADGTVKLWDASAKTPLLQSYVSEPGKELIISVIMFGVISTYLNDLNEIVIFRWYTDSYRFCT